MGLSLLISLLVSIPATYVTSISLIMISGYFNSKIEGIGEPKWPDESDSPDEE